MPRLSKLLPALMITAALAAPIAIAGCNVHERVYDPAHNDYHDWKGETAYYNQWEVETHRAHQDFKQRPADEQKQYWDWRHSH